MELWCLSYWQRGDINRSMLTLRDATMVRPVICLSNIYRSQMANGGNHCQAYTQWRPRQTFTCPALHRPGLQPPLLLIRFAAYSGITSQWGSTSQWVTSGVTSHRQPRQCRGRGPKRYLKGAQSDQNYISRLLLDCVPVFHKITTPAYLLYRSGPVAIYYSEVFAEGPKNYSYATVGMYVCRCMRPISVRISPRSVPHAGSGAYTGWVIKVSCWFLANMSIKLRSRRNVNE